MDRRRFVPSTDGLEGRMLLATRPTSGLQADVLMSTSFRQKVQRVERLPAGLLSIQEGRALPEATVRQLQADLTSIIGQLQPGAAPKRVLEAFTTQVRGVLKHPSITAAEINGLDQRFGLVLQSVGARADTVARLQASMIDLARFDTNGENSANLVANDYSFVLQTALSIGRPIQAPTAPGISPSDDTGAKGDRVTAIAQPRLVGSYVSSPGATIRIVDAAGNIRGTGTVDTNGRYSVKFDQPLSIGTHVVRVRAEESGLISPLSRPLTLKIRAQPLPAVPGGPRALR